MQCFERTRSTQIPRSVQGCPGAIPCSCRLLNTKSRLATLCGCNKKTKFRFTFQDKSSGGILVSLRFPSTSIITPILYPEPFLYFVSALSFPDSWVTFFILYQLHSLCSNLFAALTVTQLGTLLIFLFYSGSRASVRPAARRLCTEWHIRILELPRHWQRFA